MPLERVTPKCSVSLSAVSCGHRCSLVIRRDTARCSPRTSDPGDRGTFCMGSGAVMNAAQQGYVLLRRCHATPRRATPCAVWAWVNSTWRCNQKMRLACAIPTSPPTLTTPNTAIVSFPCFHSPIHPQLPSTPATYHHFGVTTPRASHSSASPVTRPTKGDCRRSQFSRDENSARGLFWCFCSACQPACLPLAPQVLGYYFFRY